MALISNAKGRGEDETASGYERLLGNRKLGMLISKVQSAVISSGNELENFLANKIKNTNGISIGKINKDKRVFKGAKTDTSGKSHKITIDCIIEKDGKIMLIEIKDGDTFDNKKVEGEIDSLNSVKEEIIKKRKISKESIEIHYCSFNARNNEEIEKGARGRLPTGFAMTGRELCKELGLDFDKIVQERKSQQKENFDFFMKEIKKI